MKGTGPSKKNRQLGIKEIKPMGTTHHKWLGGQTQKNKVSSTVPVCNKCDKKNSANIFQTETQ